jgi:hypothetical protein
MAASVFPVPVSSFNPIAAFQFTAATANTLYGALYNTVPGIYTVSCVSSTVTTVEFYSGSTLVLTAVTSSGTVSVNLGSTTDRIRLFTNTGTNIVVTITQTANVLVNNISAVLDTISTVGSSTYTGTSASGFGHAVLVGGGGGGAGYWVNPASGGGGGGACYKIVALTGSMPVTIGAGGTSGPLSTAGGGGGTSTFAGMTATGGGGGGATTSPGGSGGTGTGGTTNSTGNNGGTSSNTAGGSANMPSGVPAYVVTSLSGKGNGGQGGSGSGSVGQVGQPGVLYVLRF